MKLHPINLPLIPDPGMRKPPSTYNTAFACVGSAISALILLSAVSSDMAVEFVVSSVRGLYGAGVALGLPLPVIHLSPDVDAE